MVVVNVLKFNRNKVDRLAICQSIRTGRLCCLDSKSKVSKEANVILIFIENNFYEGVP
jgi:hypothetical protein